MDTDNKLKNGEGADTAEVMQSVPSDSNDMEALSQYLKVAAGTRQGRSIPPLDKWHPEQVMDMDLVIKSNGEWWHEGTHMTRESLVNLFATILWKEDVAGVPEYFLKTPAQKLRIKVEDAPLLINDVGIVTEGEISWLEFSTSTGDIVRLDQQHPIALRPYDDTSVDHSDSESSEQGVSEAQVRPYMMVRNDLEALIGRNTFYHLTEIGTLTEQDNITVLTLKSGGKAYQILMPNE